VPQPLHFRAFLLRRSLKRRAESVTFCAERDKKESVSGDAAERRKCFYSAPRFSESASSAVCFFSSSRAIFFHAAIYMAHRAVPLDDDMLCFFSSYLLLREELEKKKVRMNMISSEHVSLPCHAEIYLKRKQKFVYQD